MIRKLYGKADLVVGVSGGVRYDLVENYNVPADKCVAIYNFCDIADIQRQAESGLPDSLTSFFAGHRVILNVGRLVPAKNHWKLIAEFAIVRERVPDVRLLILGAGMLDDETRSLVARSGYADSILFVPFTSDPYPIYAHADIFALSSRHEGLPTVLFEAMALGVPCVSMDCLSGPREILAGRSDYNNPIHGYEITDRGILVENSPEEIEGKTHIFADAMERLLTDRDLHDRLAKNAFEYASNYDNDGILKQWLNAIGIEPNTESEVCK